MYRYFVMLNLVLFSCLTSVEAEDTIRDTVVDLAGLKQAIIDANERSPDTHTFISIPAHLYIPNNESVNSVFDGFTGDWCRLVESIGFNLTDSPECDWSSPGDLIGVATGLIWRRAGDLGGGHSYSLVPSAASLIADTYINRSGGFSPDGMVTNVEAEHWGQLQVDMESCTRGLVAYRSDLPEFGNGQFPIERLAYVKQLACIDSAP